MNYGKYLGKVQLRFYREEGKMPFQLSFALVLQTWEQVSGESRKITCTVGTAQKAEKKDIDQQWQINEFNLIGTGDSCRLKIKDYQNYKLNPEDH